MTLKSMPILLMAWLLLVATTPLQADELNYRVGPGDVLQITVTGEPEFSGPFVVRSDNSIFYGYAKAVDVSNLTTREINEKITELLGRDYLNNPNVNVSIKEYASKNVKVLGSVVKPGTYTLKGETRILDIITLAGGLSQQAGSTITIVRKKKATPALESSASSSTTTTPEASTENPEKANEKSDANKKVASNVAVATTPLPTTTMSENQNEPIVVNYSAIVNDGKLEQNILLEAEDVINVPKSNEIFVLGEVVHPGPVPYQDKLTLLQAISVAGGPSPTASTKSTYIIRKDTKGGSSKIKVRLDRIIDQKEENVVLFANDVIVIPESFF